MPKTWPIGILLLALIPAAHLAWQSRDMPHLGHYHDDGLYWVTAKSLADGHGYRILSLPGQPYETKYPPLYPLLLAGVWKLDPSFPDNLTTALLWSWLLLPACLLAARASFRDLGVGSNEAWILCAVLALSPIMSLLSISLMSDLLFGCLLLGSLSLVMRSARPEAGYWMAVAAGLAAGAAYLTRLAALPLLIAGPLWLATRKQYAKAAIYAVLMGTFVLGWSAWVRAHLAPSADVTTLYYTNYVGFQFSNLTWRDLPMVMYQNLAVVLLAITQSLIYNAGQSYWADFAWRLLAFAAVAGVIRLARRNGATPYHFFAVGFLLLVLACCWPPDARAMLPVFPLLLAGLSAEVTHVAQMVRRSCQRRDFASRAVGGALGAAIAASACALAYVMAGAQVSERGIVAQHRQLLAAKRSAYEWISRNLPPDSAFVAYDDPVLFLYTRRQGSSIRVSPDLYYRDESDTAEKGFFAVADFSQRHKLGYLLSTAGDFSRGELPPDRRAQFRRNIEQSPAFQSLYRTPQVSVYRATALPSLATDTLGSGR